MFKHVVSVRTPGTAAASRDNPDYPRSECFGEPPFVVQHARHDALPDGRFTPAALVAFTPGLRASGLLAAVPGEEIKTLLAVLCYVTSNGRIEPGVPEVAKVLSVSESKARDRLLRLQTLLWQGEPLVHSRQRELGLDVFVPSARLVGTRDEKTPASSVAAASEPAGNGSNREVIVAHSRAQYARPRAEVEQMVAEQLGYSSQHGADDTPEGIARRRLRALDVPGEYVERLVQNHPVEVITEQLDWLPHRHAKNPARLIVAAIENRYEPPARIRLERAIAAEEAKEAQKAQEQAEPRAEEPSTETIAEPASVADVPFAQTGETVSLPIPTQASSTETSEGDADDEA